MKRQSTTSYKKQGPYKRTRYSKGSSARNPIVIPDTQVRRMLNYRTAGLLGIEKKYYDTYVTSNSISAVGALTSGEVDPTVGALNNPAQGDGAQQRDGRQITMDNITIKENVVLPLQTFSSESTPEIFIALVLDKQTNGTAINSEDVFTNPSGSSITTPFCFRNMEYVSRFTVLKTVRISANQWGEISAATGTDTISRSTPFTIFHDFKGKKVNFAPGVTTSTISAIADNSVHMIAFANGNTFNPLINYNARLRFRG